MGMYNVEIAFFFCAMQTNSGHIFEDDVRFVVQMMNSRINSYVRDCKAMQLTKLMAMTHVPIAPPPVHTADEISSKLAYIDLIYLSNFLSHKKKYESSNRRPYSST